MKDESKEFKNNEEFSKQEIIELKKKIEQLDIQLKNKD